MTASVARISQGTLFFLSPGRMKAGILGESRISQGTLSSFAERLFWGLGQAEKSRCPTVPPLYTWDSGTLWKLRDNPWDTYGTVPPEILGRRGKQLSHFVGRVGQSWDKSQKEVSHWGERVGHFFGLFFGVGQEGVPWTF